MRAPSEPIHVAAAFTHSSVLAYCAAATASLGCALRAALASLSALAFPRTSAGGYTYRRRRDCRAMARHLFQGGRALAACEAVEIIPP